MAWPEGIAFGLTRLSLQLRNPDRPVIAERRSGDLQVDMEVAEGLVSYSLQAKLSALS
jgi:hypothetical protein